MEQEASLRELADRSAIVELLHRYAQGIDRSEPDMVRSCFAPDAEYELGGRLLRGEQLETLFVQNPAVVKRSTGLDRMDVTTHAVADVLIKVDGETATCESIVIAYLIGPRDGELTMLIRGVRYDDQLKCRDGKWEIVRRNHVFMWMFEATPTKIGES
jgi:SnoaL-like domain